MNADLKRLRENAGDDAALSPSAKRRAMSLSTAPIQDGNDDGTEDWMKVVEVSRHCALTRQLANMTSYMGLACLQLIFH